MSLGGCGEESDQEKVRAVVSNLLRAAADNDLEAVCSALTPRARGALVATGIPPWILRRPASEQECVDRAPDYASNSPALKVAVENGSLRVSTVNVNGDLARVKVVLGELDGTERLRRVDGEWKIDVLEIPLGG